MVANPKNQLNLLNGLPIFSGTSEFMKEIINKIVIDVVPYKTSYAK